MQVTFLIPYKHAAQGKEVFAMEMPPRVGEKVLLPDYLEGFVVEWVEWILGERGLAHVNVRLSYE